MDITNNVLPGLTVENVLSQFGVKGMHWGVRREHPSASSGPTPVTVRAAPGKKVKTAGGQHHGPADDAVRAAVSAQKAKKSTTHALSNRELQELVTRLNLEQQFSRLAPKSPSQQVVSFISQTLLSIGKEEISKVARSTASSQISEALKKS